MIKNANHIAAPILTGHSLIKWKPVQLKYYRGLYNAGQWATLKRNNVVKSCFQNVAAVISLYLYRYKLKCFCHKVLNLKCCQSPSLAGRVLHQSI